MTIRFVRLFLILAVLLGAAACGSDEGSGDGGGDDTGGSDTTSVVSGDPEVQAYCDDVTAFAAAAQEYVDAAQGGTAPDAAALADLTARSQELTTSSAALAAKAADLSPEDAEALNTCSQQANEAFAGLAG